MKRFALCIGINDYPGTQSDLSGCVNDGQDWSKELRKRGFTVSQLFDKKARRKAILEAMTATLDRAKSGDSVVFTFSGHGSFVPDRDGDEPDGFDECICPHDVVANGNITDDTLFEVYSSRPSGVRLVVISDSCHSGSVARFAPITTPPTMRSKRASPQRLVRFLPPGTFLSKRESGRLGTRVTRRASPPGRHAGLLLAGCQDSEYSYDAWFGGRPNGAFTFVALRELKKLKPTAKYRDWHRAIRRALPSQQYPQTPNLFGSSAMKGWKVFGG